MLPTRVKILSEVIIYGTQIKEIIEEKASKVLKPLTIEQIKSLNEIKQKRLRENLEKETLKIIKRKPKEKPAESLAREKVIKRSVGTDIKYRALIKNLYNRMDSDSKIKVESEIGKILDYRDKIARFLKLLKLSERETIKRKILPKITDKEQDVLQTLMDYKKKKLGERYNIEVEDLEEDVAGPAPTE